MKITHDTARGTSFTLFFVNDNCYGLRFGHDNYYLAGHLEGSASYFQGRDYHPVGSIVFKEWLIQQKEIEATFNNETELAISNL